MPVKEPRELVFNKKGAVVLKPNFTYFILCSANDVKSNSLP